MPVKAKKWFTIMAPTIFGGKQIGRTLATDPKALIGRRIDVNTADLTGDPTRYFMKLTFKIVSVQNGRAMTKFDGFKCFRDYVMRLVLKRTTRVDAVQNLTTRDKIRVRVKSIVILPRRVKTSIERSVRDRVRQLIRQEVTSSTLGQFVKRVIAGETKTRILRQTGQIYPLRDFEIRKMEVLS
jgi:small subunit ribosomal protein S3Ae